jgi:UDP-glucose 4-epimerase
MKILVTGGAGFIGSNVVDGYVEGGHDVSVIDNLFTGKKENVNPSAKFYDADIRSDDIELIFDTERPDVLNHHAAQISVPASVEDPRFDADVNVLGLLNLLECARKYGTKKVIFVSSGGAIYGEATSIPTPEDYPIVPLSPYAITKFVSETYLYFYRKQYWIDYTVLRYANIYGPRQVPHGEAGVVSIFMEQLYKGELPTIHRYEDEPEGMMRDYCFVENVVRANVIALERDGSEIFNIGTGIGTRTEELYRNILVLMRDAGHAKDPRFDNPGWGPARPGDVRKSCLDCRRAEKEIGWRPEYDITEGLKKTLQWFLEDRSI